MKIIELHMPKVIYGELENRVIDECCAVCLVEFLKEDVCRKTPCAHYFHAECLEQWLKK